MDRIKPIRIVTTLFFLILFLSTIPIQDSIANFFPEQIPSGIKINSAGQVEGTDLIQKSGNIFILKSNISRTIVVMCDGITLDGAGYTLNGNGMGTGVFLQERDNVIIKNLKITNFRHGVKYTWNYYEKQANPPRNTVKDCIITNNLVGIGFYDLSVGNIISNNYIADNEFGIEHPSDTIFHNNKFRNNKVAIIEQHGVVNDIDTSNTINGKPTYYWVGEENKVVPFEAGWVVLRNCTDITVQALRLEGNGAGVLLSNTHNSIVKDNELLNSLNGISLETSTKNIISDNVISGNFENGIYFDSNSGNNTISSNRIESNEGHGISVYALESSKGNLVEKNQITNNVGNGILIHSGQEWKISKNNIALNQACGIFLNYDSHNNMVFKNNIVENGLGVQIVNAFENTIVYNSISKNDAWGIKLEGFQWNNVIHHNNFINNKVTEGLQVSMPAIWSGNAFRPDEFLNNSFPPTPLPLKEQSWVAANPNIWDDGVEGNYWSDYFSRYTNSSEIGDKGVCDTPYYINENNVDRYPLLEPCDIYLSTFPDYTSSQKSQTKIPTPTPIPPPIRFSDPTTILLASIIILAAIGIIAYFKKYRK